jgi:hypothetical protein
MDGLSMAMAKHRPERGCVRGAAVRGKETRGRPGKEADGRASVEQWAARRGVRQAEADRGTTGEGSTTVNIGFGRECVIKECVVRDDDADKLKLPLRVGRWMGCCLDGAR